MMRTTQCRACGAEIGFIKTVAGRTMPVNPEAIQFVPGDGSEMFVTPDGLVLQGKRDPQSKEIGYTSHFATCPEADKFRKQRKSDRKKG